MRISVNVHKEGVERGLDVLADGLRDWGPAWTDISDDFMRMESERFAAEPWKGHGPLYRQWDDPVTGRGYSAHRILDDSGGLKRSLTTDETILARGALNLTLGSRYHAESNAGKMVPVAELMHNGFVARGKITIRRGAGYARPDITVAVAPRPLYELTAGDKERWAQFYVGKYVREKIAEAGL